MTREMALFGSDAPLSLSLMAMNLLIGVILALFVRWHFRRFGSTLSNREEFGQVFPAVLLTTLLVITVVKTSLALSLGLVGALSIVRFRTPIKEPEELAYLFISIAIGLGLGAGQTVPTIIATGIILSVLGILKWVRRDTGSRQLFLSVDWDGQYASPGDGRVDAINSVIARHVQRSDLRRLDFRKGMISATYLLGGTSGLNLSSLVDDMQKSLPGIDVTFLDQNQLPSV